MDLMRITSHVKLWPHIVSTVRNFPAKHIFEELETTVDKRKMKLRDIRAAALRALLYILRTHPSTVTALCLEIFIDGSGIPVEYRLAVSRQLKDFPRLNKSVQSYPLGPNKAYDGSAMCYLRYPWCIHLGHQHGDCVAKSGFWIPVPEKQ
ncbi:hypothetical protein EJ02DRAFT_425227 [Clathrospora elynae]|uniref:Uncharacterized protein n=1 Tax=Clathrospora elynae TaxID=706981 RepID=A0A6A5SHG1_9PLEO|nr:hypothetical protein EJ02DRAFT_425227 [Clathrospora elynae]